MSSPPTSILSSDDFQALLEAMPEALLILNLNGQIMLTNACCDALLGYAQGELVGQTLQRLIAERWRATSQTAFDLRSIGHVRALRGDGVEIPIEIRFNIAAMRDGHKVIGVVRADDERQRDALMIGGAAIERQRAEAWGNGQRRILEMIANNAALTETLTALARLIERHIPEGVCSILLMDANGKQLRLGAIPSLPESFRQAVDGLVVGPVTGSCGTAAFRAAPVISHDIATDPLWVDYREWIISNYGLRASWSSPILATTGKVLGTFALYYRAPHVPSEYERELVESSKHLASVAIEHKQAMEVLGAERNLLRTLLDRLPDIIFVKDLRGRFVLSNEAHRQWLRLSEEAQVLGKTAHDFYEPEQADKFEADDQAIVDTGQPLLNHEQFFHDRAGQARWHLFTKVPLKGREGKVDGIVTIARDITELKYSEERLKASLHEKELLLKEVHHRVKNNMQVINSLLNLQSGYIQEPRVLNVFRESQNRVRAMALVHEKLYQSADLAHIAFADYIRHLSDYLFRAYSHSAPAVRLKLDVADVALDIDTAIPCGLLINELISNALRHAFPDGRPGEIRVALSESAPRHFKLSVQDDGVGFPRGADFRRMNSLGLQLVVSLVEQLCGEIELLRGAGTCFAIRFAAQTDRGAA